MASCSPVRGAAGHGGPADAAVLEEDIDLDGGVAAGIEDLAGLDHLDGAHGSSLSVASAAVGAAGTCLIVSDSAGREPVHRCRGRSLGRAGGPRVNRRLNAVLTGRGRPAYVAPCRGHHRSSGGCDMFDRAAGSEDHPPLQAGGGGRLRRRSWTATGGHLQSLLPHDPQRRGCPGPGARRSSSRSSRCWTASTRTTPSAAGSSASRPTTASTTCAATACASCRWTATAGPTARSSSCSCRTRARSPTRSCSGKEALERLEEVIADLPPHYRVITLLRHDQQLSYEEIAEILQLPLGTVKARIHRARNQIQQMLAARSYDI